jgi:hypothetical protein
MFKRLANRGLKLAFLVSGLLILVFCPAVSAQVSTYEQLSTPFYDPNSSDANTCSAGSTVSSSKLPSDVVANINKLKPLYEQASTATGVPWQLLAAVHYRENNNDPNGDLQAGNPIGGPYSQKSTAYETYGGYPKSLEQSMEMAGRQLTALSRSDISGHAVNVPNPDPESIKDTLFSYNGRAQQYYAQAAALGFDPATQPYEGSPYVMNNFDDKHKDMKIITHDNGPLDGVDTRYGAYAVYVFLGGGSSQTVSSDGSCLSGDAAQNIVATILRYAWPDYHPAPYLDTTSAYQAAIQNAKANGEYVGGGDHPGIDCGGFVTRVMRDSGADPNYNQANGDTLVQQAYLEAQPEKYEKLTSITGTTDLQAGDIAINDHHTFIYVGSVKGFNGNSASASYGGGSGDWRAPMADNDASGFSDFSWYRLRP